MMLKHCYRKLCVQKYNSIRILKYNDCNIYTNSHVNSNLFRCVSSEFLRQQIITMTGDTVRNNKSFIMMNEGFFRQLCGLPSTKEKTEVSYDKLKEFETIDWTSLSTLDLVSKLTELCLYTRKYCVTPNTNCDSLLAAVSAKVSDLQREEIADILQHLIFWLHDEKYKTIAKSIAKILDGECMKRFLEFSLDDLLKFSNYFIRLYIKNKSEFVFKSVKVLSKKVKHLDSSELTNLMSIISKFGSLHINLYNIEYCIEKNMCDYSFEDFAIISRGFCANDTTIKSGNLLSFIIKTTLENVNFISDFQARSLFMIIRSSYRAVHDLDDLIIELLKHLESHLHKFEISTLIDISLLAARIPLCQDRLMSAIIDRLFNELENVRMKDVDKFLLTMTQIYYPPGLLDYQKIVNKVENYYEQTGYNVNRKLLPIILKHFAIMNVYPIHLIEKIMDPDFIKSTYTNKFAMNDEYYFLDRCIAIELPQYKGHKISDELREFFAKKYKAIMSEPRVGQSKIFNSLIVTIQKILKTKSEIHIDKLLPHFNNLDIIICLDDRNNPLPPTKFLPPISVHTVRFIPEEARKYKWLDIIYSTKDTKLKEGKKFSGYLSARFRQLEKLGFKPIVIRDDDWYKMIDDENCENYREDYMRSLLEIH